MCEKCGCSDTGGLEPLRAEDARPPGVFVHLDRLAERNRGFFRAKGVCVCNVLSFSASGAAALIERTRRDLGARVGLLVLDAAALDAMHARHAHDAGGHGHDGHTHGATDVVEESAGIDAHAIAHALDAVSWEGLKLLLIVNSGPAAGQAVHDLGETLRVAVFSTREGALKPLKFPLLFARAAAVVIADADQAGSAGCDLEQARANARRAAPSAAVFDVAADREPAAWYEFLLACAEGRGS